MKTAPKGKMRMERSMNKDFVAYDYREITVSEEQCALYRDAYENFGWELDESLHTATAQGKMKLRFRRDRKIPNKTELTRLQRNFDVCMEEIQTLETAKRSGPATAAFTAGVLGTACMAGAVFSITADPPLVVLCILLAVPGFLGWILPWFLYRWLVRRRTLRLSPIIERKYDELYEVCEKGNKLLH